MQEDDEGIGKVFWEVELRKLNDALPKSRRPISEALADNNPSYTSLAGESILMDRGEIEQIAKLAPNLRDGEVRLPFVIIKEGSEKKGVYRVDGNAAEIKTINAALGKDSANKFIYRPEIMELCKKFPTLIVFGFIF